MSFSSNFLSFLVGSSSSVQWGSELKWLLVGKEGWDYRESFHLGSVLWGKSLLLYCPWLSCSGKELGVEKETMTCDPVQLCHHSYWQVPCCGQGLYLCFCFNCQSTQFPPLDPSWYKIIAFFCSWLSNAGCQSSICDMELRGRPQGSVLNALFSVAVSFALYSLQEYFQMMFFGMSHAF